MSSIWKNSLAYIVSKYYVTGSFRQYFNKIYIPGEENLPEEGPVIFAPNHLNALMDALAVLSLPPHRLPKLFLARADLFRLPKVVVKFLRFAKILPAFRIRDGYDQLDRNKATFEEAEKSLLNRASIGIMPEGNQGEERNIRPLVKGIFRIAFSAQQKMTNGMSVKIVPVGIEYGDIFSYQESLILNIGAPIDLADYMQLYADNQVKATNELKNTLRKALESLTVHLPTGQNYPMYDALVELAAPAFLPSGSSVTPLSLFNARRRIAERLQTFGENDKQRFESIRNIFSDYADLATQLQLPVRKASRPFMPSMSPVRLQLEILLLWLTAFPGTVLNYLPYRIIKAVPGLAGIHYSGFFSSVYFGAGIVVLPLYYLLLAAFITGFTVLPWWSSGLLIPFFYFGGKLSFRLHRCIRDMQTDLQVHQLQRRSGEQLNRLLTLRGQLLDLIR